MDVSNSAWELVGNGGDAELIVQNVGDTIIGFVFASSLPQSDDDESPGYIALNSSDCGMLYQGSDPLTITTLDDNSLNMYARSLGPKDGQLFVNAIAAA